jgi:hypothetical protein
MNVGFTGAPEVVYWPTVPVVKFVTNRFDPDAATPNGTLNPEMSAGFTGAPESVYLPTVPLERCEIYNSAAWAGIPITTDTLTRMRAKSVVVKRKKALLCRDKETNGTPPVSEVMRFYFISSPP